MSEQNVAVLVITHKFGVDVSVHDTLHGAQDELLEFVTCWWEDVHNATGEYIEIPTSYDDAIALYFESVQDESYILQECGVEVAS